MTGSDEARRRPKTGLRRSHGPSRRTTASGRMEDTKRRLLSTSVSRHSDPPIRTDRRIAGSLSVEHFPQRASPTVSVVLAMTTFDPSQELHDACGRDLNGGDKVKLRCSGRAARADIKPAPRQARGHDSAALRPHHQCRRGHPTGALHQRQAVSKSGRREDELAEEWTRCAAAAATKNGLGSRLTH
jgi:hypothetical protein